MAIPSKQIGGSVNYNLLWQISKQLERLIEVRSSVTTSTTSTSTSTSSSTTTTTTTLNPNVIIGTQTWTNKNFDVATYRDGTPIPQVTDPTQWQNLTTGAWCYYNNDPANGTTYGKLYNWYAIMGIYDAFSAANPALRKQFAPTGYHVPSDIEYTTLRNYLGGEDIAGPPLKEAGTTHWNSPNTGATNSSGFTALPGGHCYNDGTFNGINTEGFWWTYVVARAGIYISVNSLYYNYPGSYEDFVFKKSGLSVRLIKD